jgi:hypothetical protein
MSGFGLAAQQPQPQPQTPPTEQTPPSQPAQRPPDPAPIPDRTSPTPDRTTESPATRSSSRTSDLATTATTVTGCVKTWDSRTMAPALGAGSGAGSAASTVSAAPTSTGAAAQYVLTNIERTGAAARGGPASFLLKTSDSGVSFSQHLNHKVEVTGTLSDSGRGPGSGDRRPADPPTADPPTGDKPSTDRDASASGRVSADDMKLPTLDVTALKMVAPTCGTGSN